MAKRVHSPAPLAVTGGGFVQAQQVDMGVTRYWWSDDFQAPPKGNHFSHVVRRSVFAHRHYGGCVLGNASMPTTAINCYDAGQL